MAIIDILAQIDAEIAALQEAKTALMSDETTGVRRRGFKKKAAGRPRKRILSAEARKKIADAQRRRWAAVRKSAGK
jgi:hypothetical protein